VAKPSGTSLLAAAAGDRRDYRVPTPGGFVARLPLCFREAVVRNPSGGLGVGGSVILTSKMPN